MARRIWAAVLMPIPGAPVGVPSLLPTPHEITLHCAYYLANDPQRMLAELAAGAMPKRIYGEAQSGDAVPHWPDALGAAATLSPSGPEGGSIHVSSRKVEDG